MTAKKTRGAAEAVAQAAVLKPKLEAAADRLNEKIAEFEKALKDLKLGVTAAVTLWESDEDPEGETLKFAKWSGDWHLVVVSWDHYGERSEKYELLRNKSRQQRLEAIALFPDLVDALIRAAEKELVRVSESADSIDALIASIKKGSMP